MNLSLSLVFFSQKNIQNAFHAPHVVVVGHTLSYTVSKFGVNPTNGSGVIDDFLHPLYLSLFRHTLPKCQHLPLCLLHLICHPWPTKLQFLFHFLHTTGLLVTRCESCAYSSASLRLGSEFARSRLRKNLIIYSASWAKRAMPPWTDEAHKNDSLKFLHYIESMLDDEISSQVHVYKLEDITKRSDESINKLVDWICQLTCRAQISDGSYAVIKFEVQCRLIGPSQMSTLSCKSNF